MCIFLWTTVHPNDPRNAITRLHLISFACPLQSLWQHSISINIIFFPPLLVRVRSLRWHLIMSTKFGLQHHNYFHESSLSSSGRVACVTCQIDLMFSSNVAEVEICRDWPQYFLGVLRSHIEAVGRQNQFFFQFHWMGSIQCTVGRTLCGRI